MNIKDDRLYLIHIHECIERIERYTVNGRDAFLQDTMKQDAVLRNLHTLTEYSQRLSEAIKTKHSEIEWQKISGFRNIVVHDYLGIDLEGTWIIIEKDLPLLKKTIEKMKHETGTV